MKKLSIVLKKLETCGTSTDSQSMCCVIKITNKARGKHQGRLQYLCETGMVCLYYCLYALYYHTQEVKLKVEYTFPQAEYQTSNAQVYIVVKDDL